jgi:hypothetical protein
MPTGQSEQQKRKTCSAPLDEMHGQGRVLGRGARDAIRFGQAQV